jgi:hypothetical protein
MVIVALLVPDIISSSSVSLLINVSFLILLRSGASLRRTAALLLLLFRGRSLSLGTSAVC